MHFGFNDVGFPHDDRAENIAAIAEAGYDGVELTLDEDGALADPAIREDLLAMTEEHGLEIPSVHTLTFWEYPLTSTDEETRREGIEQATRFIEAAADLGAEVALVVPGVVDESTPYDEAYENSLESMHELAGVAADHDVTLAVENVWNKFLLTPREFAEFVDDAARSGPVDAYFDVGNILRFGYPEQWIRILGDRIVAVHVKDFDQSDEVFTYPLQGDVDWEAVAAALDDIGYDGWIAPEVSPYETNGEQMPAQVLDNLRTVF